MPRRPSKLKEVCYLSKPLNQDMTFSPNSTCSILHRMHIQLQLLMAWTIKKKGETKYVRGRGRACPVKVRLSQFLPNHFQEVNMVIQIRWLDQHISCFSQELKREVFIVKRICFVITWRLSNSAPLCKRTAWATEELKENQKEEVRKGNSATMKLVYLFKYRPKEKELPVKIVKKRLPWHKVWIAAGLQSKVVGKI